MELDHVYLNITPNITRCVKVFYITDPHISSKLYSWYCVVVVHFSGKVMTRGGCDEGCNTTTADTDT